MITFAGTRDVEHSGKTLKDFLAAANKHIADGMERLGQTLEPSLHFLTEEEVMAVRLYTGPGFQAVNNFLREMGKLSRHMRNRLARCAELTYAATTRAICSAIRKLARVTVGTAAGELSAKRVGEMAVARAVARTAIGAAVAKAGASEAAAGASSLLHSSLSMANAAAAAPIAIDPLSESAQCVRAATRLQAALRGHTARVAEGLKPERSAAVATARVRAKQTLTAFELRSFPPGSPSSSSLTLDWNVPN